MATKMTSGSTNGNGTVSDATAPLTTRAALL
jgi:hypothetical protein